MPASKGKDQWPLRGIVLPHPVVMVKAGLVWFSPKEPTTFSGVAPVAGFAFAE